jgi:hypothetical protein
MSKRDISLNISYKQALIIKHALRDKPNRDKDEENAYQEICEAVERFKVRCHITTKSHTEEE